MYSNAASQLLAVASTAKMSVHYFINYLHGKSTILLESDFWAFISNGLMDSLAFYCLRTHKTSQLFHSQLLTDYISLFL